MTWKPEEEEEEWEIPEQYWIIHCLDNQNFRVDATTIQAFNAVWCNMSGFFAFREITGRQCTVLVANVKSIYETGKKVIRRDKMIDDLYENPPWEK